MAQAADAEQEAKQRRERADSWRKGRVVQERRLRLAAEQAEADVAAADAKLAALRASGGGGGAISQAKPKAKARQHKAPSVKQEADSSLEDDSSEDDVPLSAWAGTGGKRKRGRAAVVDLTSDDDDSDDMAPLSALLARASTGGKGRQAAGLQGSNRSPRLKANPAEGSPPVKVAKRSAGGRVSRFARQTCG